jgi:hypothetical protein
MSEPVAQGPRPGCFFFALPIILTVVVASMYLLLFGLGSITGSAHGQRVTWTVNTCPAGKDIIVQRVRSMGLGEPVWAPSGSVWKLTATLPGRDAEVDKRVPEVLGQPGELGVFAGAKAQKSAQIVGSEQVVSTSFTLRELGSPLIEVRLTNEGLKALRTHMADHAEGSISVWLDRTLILDRGNRPIIEGNLIELRDHGLDGKKVLATTAEWAIILGHGPLPCRATLSE